ncbi:hypothetical protein [Gracilibacillus sp. YIM 98692]|uniref:hypothetical protein n=1 Tax=Gracilibacillus sp. YIM 98692 TaxID=2663532 RepID=UPI0013D12D83|nr:hypothetical protein [Gracilibacillus sp. YIM 98692]
MTDKKTTFEKGKEMLDKVSEKLEGYLEIKKEILDNEYMQLLGDTSKVVGFLRNANTLITQKRFEAFLKGFNKDEIPTEKQLAKLLDYIDDEEKAQFISDTFSKILLSKSTKSCMILGLIMYKVIEEKEEISHNYLVCVDGLMNLFDNDIDNIKFVYDYFNESEKTMFRLESREFIDLCQSQNVDRNSLELSVEKALNYQLLRKTYEIDLNIDSDDPGSGFSEAENDEYIRESDPGKLLYNYILLSQRIE